MNTPAKVQYENVASCQCSRTTGIDNFGKVCSICRSVVAYQVIADDDYMAAIEDLQKSQSDRELEKQRNRDTRIAARRKALTKQLRGRFHHRHKGKTNRNHAMSEVFLPPVDSWFRKWVFGGPQQPSIEGTN